MDFIFLEEHYTYCCYRKGFTFLMPSDPDSILILTLICAFACLVLSSFYAAGGAAVPLYVVDDVGPGHGGGD